MKIKKDSAKKAGALTIATLTGALVSELIIGDLNWQPLDTHPDPVIQEISLTEVDVRLSNSNRCNGFFVAPNILMTNNHCVPNSMITAKVTNLDLKGLRKKPTFIKCGRLLHTSPKSNLDYSLVECEADIPSVTIDVNPVFKDETINIIHQQCPWHLDSFCQIRKMVSEGKILETKGRKIKHSADTLGGTSGAPIFRNGGLIGIHNSGMPELNGAPGAGVWNGGVSIREILKDIPPQYREKMVIKGDIDLTQYNSEPFVPAATIGGGNLGWKKKKTFWQKVKCFFRRGCKNK